MIVVGQDGRAGMNIERAGKIFAQILESRFRMVFYQLSGSRQGEGLCDCHVRGKLMQKGDCQKFAECIDETALLKLTENDACRFG